MTAAQKENSEVKVSVPYVRFGVEKGGMKVLLEMSNQSLEKLTLFDEKMYSEFIFKDWTVEALEHFSDVLKEACKQARIYVDVKNVLEAPKIV